MQRVRNAFLKTVLIVGLFFAGMFVVSHGVQAAAVNVGLTPEVGNALGLGTTDIRVTIATIIRDFMALLGIVAVLLILYGGFLYMTASGDETKVDKAKQVIVAAAIGLAIILSAVAIAQYVLSTLGKATGLDQYNDYSGCDNCGDGLTADAFFISSVSPLDPTPPPPTPQSSKIPRNVVVRVFFSKSVDPASVSGNLVVIGPNGAVAGTLNTTGDLVEFTPDAACPKPNIDRKCFDGLTKFTISVTTGVKSVKSDQLLCGGFAPPCTASFTTNDIVDVSPPNPVEIISPDDGQSIPVDTKNIVQVHAVDDSGVSYADLTENGNLFGKALPDGNKKVYFLGSLDTKGMTLLSEHTLSARAYDLDSNSSVSSPVTVTVRALHCFDKIMNVDETGLDCGGADCAVCGGGACTKNADCASNLCVNGICVDRPRIDSVTPIDKTKTPNGAPGTLVTISGAFFGTTPGTVSFAGSSSSTAKDAALCDPTAWTPDEITVIVPDQAVNGPISVTASNNEVDFTNDARGPLINDFSVNSSKHPGICTLTQTSGEPGTAVGLKGSGFGITQGNGRVYYNVAGTDSAVSGIDAKNWSDALVTGNVPTMNLDVAALSQVRLTQGNLDSNSKGFIVQPFGAGKAPRIDSIDPEKGTVKDYVTIRGANFGTKAGTVLLSLKDQTTAIGDTSFPEACSTNFWNDTSIVIKVPAFYKDNTTPVQTILHSVRVRRADSVESNISQFTIIDGAPSPGICALLPDNGPVGTTKVDVVGERFGIIKGDVSFAVNKSGTLNGSWNDQKISAVSVPGDAITGPVRVVNGGKTSNGVPFLVGSCTSNDQCTQGRSCCGDGTCRDSCANAQNTGAYAWRFSTGLIPMLPQVVESLACVDKPQSPSPYKGRIDVCPNTGSTSATFNTKMNAASLQTNYFIYACGTGNDFDASTCAKTPLDNAGIKVTSVTQLTDMVSYFLKSNLDPDAWYSGVIRSGSPTGTKSVDGKFLDGDYNGIEGGDYVWHFRARHDPTNCKVDHVNVNPSSYQMSKKSEYVDYLALPTAANCDQLMCSYTVQWSSLLNNVQTDTFTTLTPVDGMPACVERSTAKAETLPGSPLHETATIVEEQKSGYGLLDISYAKPEITKFWPNCAGACVNSGVGAGFNVGMDQKTLNKNTVKLCACTDAACSKFSWCSDSMLGISVNPKVTGKDQDGKNEYKEVEFVLPGGTLVKSTWYRVIISSGPSGVKSASGAQLASVNYGFAYSWKFKTREDGSLCDVDKITVEPAIGSVYIFGDTVTYTSTPWSKADDLCGATPLDSLSYNWQWRTKNVAAIQEQGGDQNVPVGQIATLDFKGAADFLPLKDGPGCSVMCLPSGSIPQSVVPGGSVCGNGIVEPSEDCDEAANNGKPGSGCTAPSVDAQGNQVSGCLATGVAPCSQPGQLNCCGNGNASEKGKTCDDGNTLSGDGCSSLCLAEGSGLGTVGCGNGKIESGENCDDGNLANGDGCNNSCLLEGSVPGKAVCGNGIIEPGEQCDDGNAKNSDGCSSICLREGSGIAPSCGNSIVEVGEDCDHGANNGKAGDSCTSKCLLTGSVQGQAVCGNGKIELGESCDDSNTTNGDGCSSTCLLEGIGACQQPGQKNCCGDGVLKETGKACEDGNAKNGDGCSSQCLNEGTLLPSVCGDGKVDPRDESCDDGNTKNGDGCSSQCLSEGTQFIGSACGDGEISKGETCDDGNTQSGDGCSANCLHEGTQGNHPVCGNSVVDDGEECDHGAKNGQLNDGCSNTCLFVGVSPCLAAGQKNCCGNGNVNEPGKACDDGNTLDGDGCSSFCLAEGSSSRYSVYGKTDSWCGYHGDIVKPTPYGTGEMCEFKTVGDNHVDPLQYARATFGGTADINASIVNAGNNSTVTGTASFDFVCNCTDDNSCTALVPHLIKSVGCGLGHCCYNRPSALTDKTIPSPIPDPEATDVCRNAVIAGQFDQLMETKSIASSTVLLMKSQNGTCTKGTELPFVSALDDVNKGYCLVSATSTEAYSVSNLVVTDKDGKTTSQARITLKKMLEPMQTYAVLFLGDHHVDDKIKEGVQSVTQVAMKGDYFWKFTTGAVVCQIDHVSVSPDSWLFQTAQNNPDDDVPNQPNYDSIADSDKLFTSDSWTKNKNGEFQKIQSVQGYSWEWNWTSSDAKNKSLQNPDQATGQQTMIRTVATPDNQSVTLTGSALVTQDAFGKVCKVKADCDNGLDCKPALDTNRCAGQIFSADAKIVVLMCENPWPSRSGNGSWAPSVEKTTNFSFYYCRDAGKPGDTTDDLPAPMSDIGVLAAHAPDLVCSNNFLKTCNIDTNCGQNAACEQHYLADILYPLNCANGACTSGDALGFRVIPNMTHDDVKKWYTMQGFKGNPSASTIDGFSALSDGRTTYVSAVNKIGDPDLYSNVYLLSYNEGASNNTKAIGDAVLQNWKFNTNISQSGLCALSYCSNNPNTSCVVTADCTAGAGENVSCAPVSCSSDSECGGGKGLCMNTKAKMQRDMARLVNFRQIESALENYRASTLKCDLSGAACLTDQQCPIGEHCVGNYPTLQSGSYIRGFSLSSWDSWKQNLGTTLSAPLFPVDPLNTASCDTGVGGYATSTCFNASKGTLSCDIGSHVYQYRREGTLYNLSADFEYRVCKSDGTKLCLKDSDCGLSDFCIVPAWKGINAFSHSEFDAAQKMSVLVTSTWNYQGACTGAVYGGNQPVCGDGFIEPGEECEIGQTKTDACSDAQNKYAGSLLSTCGTSGQNACKWISSGTCALGMCGDGITQNPPEICDDGALNGLYGRCAAPVQGKKPKPGCDGPSLAGHCGDGITQGSEMCDFGGYCHNNPGIACAKQLAFPFKTADQVCGAGDWCVGIDIYGKSNIENSCSFDCKKVGPYCGDKIVQPQFGEECDGNQMVDTQTCPACPANWPLTADQQNLKVGKYVAYGQCDPASVGHQQARIQNCTAPQFSGACTWRGWGPCTPTGICGDGKVDPGEVCDDGGNSNNTGSCIIVKNFDKQTKSFVVDMNLSCKKATCGDGFTEVGVEQCDNGSANINPSDAPAIADFAAKCAYGKVCQFCTTSCSSSSVSGGYCGDKLVAPNYELCELGITDANTPKPKFPNPADPDYPKGAKIQSLCYPDCQAYCPPNFLNTPTLKFTRSVQSPNYLDELTDVKPGDTNQLIIPPCRYLNAATVNLSFKAALPTLGVVFEMRMDHGIITNDPGNNQQNKLITEQNFVKTLIGKMDDLYKDQAGKLHISLVTAGLTKSSDLSTHWFNIPVKDDDLGNEFDGLATTFDKKGQPTFVFPDKNGFCWEENIQGNPVASDPVDNCVDPKTKKIVPGCVVHCIDTGKQQNGVEVFQCPYLCTAEKVLESPVFSVSNLLKNEFFVNNVPGSFSPLVTIIDTKMDPAETYAGWSAAGNISSKLLTQLQVQKKIVVTSGNVNCGGTDKNGIAHYNLHFDQQETTDCNNIQNQIDLGYGNGVVIDKTIYDYSSNDIAQFISSLKNEITKTTLTLSGVGRKNTSLLQTQGVVLLPIEDDVDGNGLRISCKSNEQRFGITLNWVGGGTATISNAVPSYCPIVK